ncbi:hypothetical protein J2T09_004783 [Neorhizobium huautlense]|uniref:Uncharacterized protein n=1 Tax=Neorhizobium huautlense TaxID=67774 RepID=A0ABT9Q0X3_9HYPH|nr:hypothetical protein [Neorhizobium huautlense]MDP9840003.1 hypothetical protein [Neorhizobium huautlense]
MSAAADMAEIGKPEDISRYSPIRIASKGVYADEGVLNTKALDWQAKLGGKRLQPAVYGAATFRHRLQPHPVDIAKALTVLANASIIICF